MKRMVCFLCVLLSICFLSAVSVYAENGETDLPINTQGIKDREHKDAALTDAYGVNILTKEYSKIQQKMKLQQNFERIKIKDSLLTNEYLIEDFDNAITEQVKNAQVFMKPHTYAAYESSVLTQKTPQILLWMIIFLVLAVISFLAALAVQQKKRRKNNVYNSNNENEGSIF